MELGLGIWFEVMSERLDLNRLLTNLIVRADISIVNRYSPRGFIAR